LGGLHNTKELEKFSMMSEAVIEEIGEQAGESPASFGTKQSGLEALRKIGNTILLSCDTIGYEVRKQFQSDSALEDAMLENVGNMSDEECQKMCDIKEGRTTFLEKLEELASVGKEQCVFEGLNEVFSQLCNESESHEEHFESDESEEESGNNNAAHLQPESVDFFSDFDHYTQEVDSIIERPVLGYTIHNIIT
jgi:acyl-CoA synthetase (AMP-forming)/AMP-acid ligase II